ncbi:hypothetical protein A5784_05545 [Mycobacterium sp. 852013-50091_SCH5140682]|nr:hypothetical protein A5784_05545 [Mycobacterium sp. 852013-50091_SCH5140682]
MHVYSILGRATMTVHVGVAWTLADTTSHWFTESDRSAVYSALGAGDSYSAILRTLDIAVQMRQALPAKLVADLTRWVDGYAGHQSEQRLRQLLEAYSPQNSHRRDGGRRCSELRRHGSTWAGR